MDYPGQIEESEFLNYKIHEKKILEEANNMDRGYNKISRNVQKTDGRIKRTKIDIYTSGGVSSKIRDAETGQYYASLVGSLDEDLFFKVTIATGECTSKNGSSTAFYTSPQQYMSHQSCVVDPEIISNWEQKRSKRLKVIKK